METELECITSSEGLRNILRLLSSSPPETTVKELKKLVIEGVLSADYHQKDGRRHTHWRTRVYNVLMHTPDLTEELIRQGIEKIFDGLQENSTTEWTADLWFIPNLPEDLKNNFLKLNHHHFSATKAVKKALNEILPLWLGASMGDSLFEEEKGVPLFADKENWQLLDRTEKGALLYLRRLYAQRGETMVVLLPDVNNGGEGCAIEVAPLAKTKTVHQAIAWMYQQDPKKWKGFDKEV